MENMKLYPQFGNNYIPNVSFLKTNTLSFQLPSLVYEPKIEKEIPDVPSSTERGVLNEII